MHGNRKAAYKRREMPEYKSWLHMKWRCFNKNSPNYETYGGRGITIHPDWVDDFDAFYKYIGPRPGEDYTVDRINNDGNYEPGNVRWATRSEQNKNRRPFARPRVRPKVVKTKKETPRPHVYRGKNYTLKEISELTGIPYDTLQGRVYKHGWSIEKAVTTPVKGRYPYEGKSLSLKQIAEITGVELTLLQCRVIKYKWDLERAINTGRQRPNIYS